MMLAYQLWYTVDGNGITNEFLCSDIHYQAFVFPDGCKAAIWEPTRDWREAYLAALLELDAAKLKRKFLDKANQLNSFQADLAFVFGAGFADPNHAAAPPTMGLIFQHDFDELSSPQMEIAA